MMTNATTDHNPAFARVIGYVDRNNQLADNWDDGGQFKLLVNSGEREGTKVGDRVLVFALGPEVIDPIDQRNLGHFEVVRGQGRVVSVQQTMAVISCTDTAQEYRVKGFGGLTNAMAALGNIQRETELVTVAKPFKFPEIGDLIRFI